MANPYLNAGCGRLIFPAPRPAHHGLIEESIYSYPFWLNVDRNMQPGVDLTADLFKYPWPFADNSFDAVLCAHFLEHVPHEIRPAKWNADAQAAFRTAEAWDERWEVVKNCQDGWYAIMAEIYRVLSPGGRLYVISPYAWSQGAITDPTHTRYLTEHTFNHSLQPNPDAPFEYNTAGINLRSVHDAKFSISELYQHLLPADGDLPGVVNAKWQQLVHAMRTQINVVYDIAVTLEAVK